MWKLQSTVDPFKVLRILKMIVTIQLSTFEFWLELAWLGANCKSKTLLVVEIFFIFFKTALSQSSIVAQYPKKNMIKCSQQSCWMGAKFKFHYNYRILTWLRGSQVHMAPGLSLIFLLEMFDLLACWIELLIRYRFPCQNMQTFLWHGNLKLIRILLIYYEKLLMSK